MLINYILIHQNVFHRGLFDGLHVYNFAVFYTLRNQSQYNWSRYLYLDNAQAWSNKRNGVKMIGRNRKIEIGNCQYRATPFSASIIANYTTVFTMSQIFFHQDIQVNKKTLRRLKINCLSTNTLTCNIMTHFYFYDTQ